ncbi:MBL fold metallo-hydrolase [Opitutus terrae]|uniref:Beta-lactamase domain protein n=1 Tax=Opitutus terrae (strain DSM 11246 / JCM 15787 / PB90-1) TaxID=452637 RepID=B1ZVE3_OPITP|nr:MBL fold metallo-hydrolase [Opitutus terrae]ACB76810.1 beta-lactamase domain protein [Opitutus terrae PB90-1]
MARIPLEDNFTDVIGKAQRGLHITDADLAGRAGISTEDLAALKSGRPLVAVLRRVARHLRLSPDALEALATNAWYPAQPNFPTGFAAFNTRYDDMTVNSYLVWDARSKQAAAFDTGADSQALVDTAAAEHLSVRYLFLTHTHEDHIADLARLVAATGAEVWSHEKEPLPGAKTFRENAHFHLGPLAIKTLLTPGHSPGLTTFYVTGLSWPLAVTGDAIFASSIGGSTTDFEQQYRATRDKVLSLPRDTVLAPGHGPLTTVAQEKQANPFFAR